MLGLHKESHHLVERRSTEKMKAKPPDLEWSAADYGTLFTIIMAEQNAADKRKPF